MKNTMKKILCTVLVVVMCLTAAPLQGFADLDGNWLDFSLKASAATEGYYTYEVENGEATITGVDSSISGDVTIPSTLGGYSVISIGRCAFDSCKSLKSIIIPDSVTSIGEEAFYECTSLTSITVDENNINYSNDSNGVLFNKDKTELVIYPASNTSTTYIIPDSVTRIGEDAFRGCKYLTSISIPDGVTSLDLAFYGCTSLTNITIPSSVTSIKGAFYGCTSLTSITIPDSVTSIGVCAFWNCPSLTSITIPDSVTSIGEYAFYGCTNLTSVTIPDSVTSIGEYAFAICPSLTNITIPASVTSLGLCAFALTGLTNITIPASVTSIGMLAFTGCLSLTNITVDADNQYFSNDGSGVLFNKDKSILVQYSAGNTRSSYIIPDSVTKIGEGAFYGCTSLTSLTIPESVTSIGEMAFDEITGLEDVYYMGSQSQWSEISIGSDNEDLTNAKIHFTSCTANLGKHVYTSEITTAPTHFKEGVETFTCACGDTYTSAVAVIPHSYSETVTAPTCKEKGYTTFTCNCGYSYKGNYVEIKEHSYVSTVTRPATHLEEGLMTYTCSACDNSYTEAIAKTKEHSYVASKVVAPTCEKEGYTVYVCECGHSENRDKKSATGHEYDGLNCKICGKKCSCNCHKGGISGFFWKISNFFNKLFKIKSKQTCACGVNHY